MPGNITFLLLDLILSFTVEHVLISARIIGQNILLQYMHLKIVLSLSCIIVHTGYVQHMITVIGLLTIQK